MKRRSWGWIIALATVAGAAMVWSVWPRERLLFDRAVRSSPIDAISQVDTSYHWSSDQEVIVAHDSIWHRVTSTASTPLIGLNKVEATQIRLPDADALSPDGRYLLWTQEWDKFGPPPGTYSLATDGSHVHFWDTEYNAPHWLHDSRHWIAFNLEYEDEQTYLKSLYLFDVANPRTVQTLPTQGGKGLGIEKAIGNPTISSIGLRFSLTDAVVTTQNHILLDDKFERGEDRQEHLNILELGLGKTVVPLHHFTVHVSLEALIGEHAYSPQGDRIAWLFTHEQVDVMSELIHRLLPWYPIRYYRATTLQVSNLDGSHWRELGHYTPRSHSKDADGVGQLQWTPDGRHISFIYRDALWTVPAE